MVANDGPPAIAAAPLKLASTDPDIDPTDIDPTDIDPTVLLRRSTFAPGAQLEGKDS